jgi:hypothetical protein
VIARILSRLASKRAPVRVELVEGVARPDDEATEVTTRGELEEVEGVDMGDLNTGQVAHGANNTVVVVVNNQRTAALNVAASSELTNTSAELAGVLGLEDIIEGTDSLKGGDGLLGLGHGLNGSVEDERNLRNSVDVVSASEDNTREGRGSQGRGDGESLLVDVDLSVPASPGLGRGEHATLAAHVTEGTLTRARVTTTSNTGNTSNGTTSTPGLGRVLVTSARRNGIGLAAVLGKAEKGRKLKKEDNMVSRQFIGEQRIKGE